MKLDNIMKHDGAEKGRAAQKAAAAPGGRAAEASPAMAAERLGAAWGLLLVLVAAVFEPYIEDAFSLPKAGVLRVGALLAAAWMLRQALTGVLDPAGVLAPRALDRPVLAFLAAALVFTVFSLHPYQSFFGQSQQRIWGFWSLASFALVYWGFSRLPEPVSRRWLWWSVVCAGTLALGYDVVQRLGLDPIRWRQSSLAHPIAMFGSAVNYGPFLLMLLPFLLSRLYQARTPARALPWALGLGLATFELLFSLRRGCWLGALAAVGLWASWNLRACRRSARLSILAAAALAVFLAVNWSAGRPDVRERMEVFLSPKEGSAASRLSLWGMSLRMMLDQKGVGSGLDTYGFLSPRYEVPDFRRLTGPRLMATNAHNEVLQVGVTMGLPGLAAYGWLLLAFAGLAWRRFKETPATLRGFSGARLDYEKTEDSERLELSPLPAAFLGLWVQALFNFNSVVTTAYAWAFLGTLCAMPAPQVALPAGPARSRVTGLLPALLLLLALAAAVVSARHYLADKHFKYAAAAIKRLSWDRAILRGEKALRLNPWGQDYPMPLAHAYRARALQQGSPEAKAPWLDKAIAVFQGGAARYPLDPDSRHNYAMSLMWRAFELKDQATVPRALSEEGRALELAPLYFDFWSTLGQIHHFAGELPEAKKAWLKAMELSPGLPSAASWLEQYASKVDFRVAEQDLFLEGFPLGREVDLLAQDRPIKIANLEEKPLRLSLEVLPYHRSSYRLPEGYAEAPAEASAAPAAQEITVAPSAIAKAGLRLKIPSRRRFAGRRFCFLVRIRALDFDVPPERVVRVMIETQRRGK